MRQETEREASLKKRMEELSEQLSQKNVGTVLKDVQLGQNVTLHIGSGKFAKVLKANARYEDFLSTVQTSLGTDNANVGYRDDQGRTVWIRTKQDIHFMSMWYFAQELPFIQIVSIPLDDISTISKNLNKEKIYKSGMAIFRCESVGPDGPLIFLAIPNNMNKDEGFKYLTTVFGQINSLMFVDEAEDIITIDSTESWEYCIETGVAMSKIGRFPLLLMQAGGQ